MKEPRLLDYTSYRDFLKDYHLYRQSQRPGFTLTRWSQKLQLTIPASLTRVLSGDRLPGGKITQALIQYFQFNASEADYFETLIQIEKLKKPSDRQVFLDRLEQIRLQLETNSNNDSIVMQWEGSQIVLWGSASECMLNEHLAQEGLEVLASEGSGRSTIGLRVSQIRSGSLGTTSEFSVGCSVRSRSNSFYQHRMFCDFHSVADVSAQGKLQDLGIVSDIRDIQMTSHVGPSSAQIQISENGQQVISLTKGHSLLSESISHPANRFQTYFKGRGHQAPVLLESQASSFYREFDPRVDQIQWKPENSLGQFLQKVDFRPLSWSSQPSLVVHLMVAIKKQASENSPLGGPQAALGVNP